MLLYRLIRASQGIHYRDADGRERTLLPLLENNVLTVMADIRRKKLSGYGDTFADVQGTAKQSYYVEKLQKDNKGWVARLENYLSTTWQTDSSNNPAVEIARQLKDRLEQSLPNGSEADKRSYYRMLRTLTDLQSNADRYLNQTEESGDTEPALSLLIAYLKNYGNVANKRGTVLQVDQAAPQNQKVLGYIGECDRHPNLLCHNYLLPCVCPNSCSYYMRNLRAIYNRAVEKELTSSRSAWPRW